MGHGELCFPSLRRTGTFTVLPDPPKPAYELPKTFSEAPSACWQTPMIRRNPQAPD